MHIGNTGLLVKIPTYILGYTRNTHMVTHAVILSIAKDLLACNTKPIPQLLSLRRSHAPTWLSIISNVILSTAKDLIARNTMDKQRIDLKLRYFTQNDNPARIVATHTNTHLR